MDISIPRPKQKPKTTTKPLPPKTKVELQRHLSDRNFHLEIRELKMSAAIQSDDLKTKMSFQNPKDEEQDADLEEGEILDEGFDVDAKLEEPVVHPLENTWKFWFDSGAAKSSSSDWGSSMFPIHSFSTVEDFWGLYNNLNSPGKFPVGSDFYCFKEHIEPKWEDPQCDNGGKWTANFPRGKSEAPWLYTLLGMIGEQFDYGEEICGAVVNVRGKQERVSIWTKDASNEIAQTAIGSQWKKMIDCHEVMGFIVHEDAKNDRNPKNKYTV